jgi:alkylhydroperoxidase family enzyme
VRLWAYSPLAQQAHQRLGDTLHNRTTVSRKYKEVVIVRACTRSYGAYELFHHVPLAVAAGLSHGQVAAIQSFAAQYDDRLDAGQKAAIEFADELDSGKGVCAMTWRELHEHFNDTEILELALQSQYWSANARFTRTLESPEEPRFQASRKALLNGEAQIPVRPPVELAERATTDAGYQLRVVRPGEASAKGENWFARWRERFGEPPPLVQLWALNEHIQFAYQLAWEAVFGGGLELPAPAVARIASRVALRNGSPAAAQMAAQTLGISDITPEPRDDRDRLAFEFVDAWDAGRALGDREVGAMLELFSKREVVELQVITGLAGGQARIAHAAGIG